MTVVEARMWLLPPMVTLSLHARAGSEGSERSGSVGREILRCAQDDRVGLCHPFVPLRAGSERSEGSVVCICPADLTHVA